MGMKKFEKTYITVNLKGFKSYKEQTIIGPFSGLLGIYGKNGSGKTNIIDALELLFASNLKDSTFKISRAFFSRLLKHKEFSFVKIGVNFKKKDRNFSFTKIISYSNVTDYFFNNQKSSFKNFLNEISKLKFANFKKLLSIVKLSSNSDFFSSDLLYGLIEDFSNSKECIKKILKTDFLVQKLQQNYIFYSRKLKIITDEKKFLLNNIKKTQILCSKKIEIKKKLAFVNFYKANWFMNKIWTGIRRLKVKTYILKEISMIEKNLVNFFRLKQIIIIKNNNPLEKFILNQIEKFLKFSSILLTVMGIKTSYLLEIKS